MKSLNPTELKRLHRSWRRQSESRLALLLDGVQGPFNVGSILRTAAAMHVSHVYAIDLAMSWTDVKVQKTAMGTHRFLQLTNVETAEEAVSRIRSDGYQIVGLELATSASPVWQVEMSGDTCIAVGHEDRGLSSTILHESDALAYVPQFGRVGSLNVATAAAIACYESRRQTVALFESTEGDADEA